MPSVTPSILLKTQVIKPMVALVTAVWTVVYSQTAQVQQQGRMKLRNCTKWHSQKQNTPKWQIPAARGGEQGLAAEGSKEARGRGANRNTLYLSYSGSQPQAFVKLTKLYIESWWIGKSHAQGWNLYIYLLKQTGKKWWARFTNHIAVYISQMKSRKQQGLTG